MKCWEKIDELRLLTNLVKHGDGSSATDLKNVKPSYFKDFTMDINLMDLYLTVLDEIVLTVTDDDFLEYCDSILNFWDELPEELQENI